MILFLLFFLVVGNVCAKELAYENSTGKIVEITTGESTYKNKLGYSIITLENTELRNKSIQDIIFDLNTGKLRAKTNQEVLAEKNKKDIESYVQYCIELKTKLSQIQDIKKSITSNAVLQIISDIELKYTTLLQENLSILNNE